MKNTLFAILLILGLSLSAQEKPTLYLIGDSTMSDKKDPEINPEHGWGQMLPELMSDEIYIENHAVNGRSSKSFITENRWKTVKNKLKKGDFLIIQFGHNDQKFEDSTRFTNPLTEYRYNLEKFVKEARDHGATPILMSSIVRRNFNSAGVLEDTHGIYPLTVRMVANDLDVPFIDMQWLTEQLEVQYGPIASEKLHLHYKPGEDSYYPEGKEDNTHLSAMGARLVASLALQQIARDKLPLASFIKDKVLQENILK